MGRLGYCVPCGARRRDVDAVVVIDGDPMCAGCARGAEPVKPDPDEVPEPKAPRAELCAHGCGNPRHRGRCAGRPVGGFDAAAPKVRSQCHVLPTGKWPIESARAEAFRLRSSKSALAISKVIGWAQPTISRWFREADAAKHPEEGTASVEPAFVQLLESKRVELGDLPPAVGPLRRVLEDGVMRPVQATVSATAAGVLSVKVKAGSMDRLVAEEVAIDAVPKVAVLRRPLGRAGELWVRFQALAPGLSLKVKCRDAIHAGTTHRDLVAKAKKFGLAVGSRRVGNDYYCWRINGSV